MDPLPTLEADGVTAAAAPADAPSIFVDVAASAGLDFVHQNGMSGQRFFVEMMGPGAALFDYDGDGDLDAYLLQGHPLSPSGTSGLGGAPAPLDRLYRNELVGEASDVAGTERLRFVDVTDASGIHASGYGMGAAVGDVDNDGRPDLYLANWGADQLWHNLGDGRFEEIGARSGIEAPGWSSSASFLDYDRDGWLDLFVTRYVDYDLDRDSPCFAPETGERDYCGPQTYRPMSDRLFRNRGDGSFEDLSTETGVAGVAQPGLGVVAADFDADGWTDLYVANDGAENQLWMNQAGLRFVDRGPISGSAVNRAGMAQASMGLAAEDFDGDGDLDLFMTHLRGETNTLLVNDGAGFFEDRTHRTGLAQPSLGSTAFGVAPLDFDNDGWQDLLVVNGAVTEIAAQRHAGLELPLEQGSQLFRNRGDGSFADVSGQAGPALVAPAVGRGVAWGDVDNDGDGDALVVRNQGPPLLLIDQVGQDRRWIGLSLIEAPGGRASLGARVTLRLTDGRRRLRRVHGDGSYGSASDARVVVGLGEADEIADVEVAWPNGTVESWTGLEPGRYHTLVRGSGSETEGGG